MTFPTQTIRAAIPSVDRILRLPALEPAMAPYGRAAVTEAVRAALAALRRTLDRPGDPATIASEAIIVDSVLRHLDAMAQPSLRRVFNLTGTVLHTNLGRAPLPPEAVTAMCEAAGACNLEYDL